jgi:hypothetical protein
VLSYVRNTIIYKVRIDVKWKIIGTGNRLPENEVAIATMAWENGALKVTDVMWSTACK